jgi:4-amino-4-deoxy-L-arabinose transferase-like glycosyltransferase
MPTAAWICALVAFLNAASWSVISPPFQVPDEPDHFQYAQTLAEVGRLPSSSSEKFPPQEYTVLTDLRYPKVRFQSLQKTISSLTEQRALEGDLAAPLARAGGGNAGVAAAQPPLYYALETIPYELGSSGTLLDQLALMRLLSALMGCLTALFAYLFLREALPGAPWAWTVGGLSVALAPLLGMMSGAVNPDALLFAVSTALFYCLARGFRHGLTPKLAAAIGALLATGAMTKLTFLALVPGVILGLLTLTLRAWRNSRRNALRSLALATSIATGPILLYLLINTLSGRSPASSAISGTIALHGESGSILQELSYIWQFYLPPLPGMHPYFHGFLTTQVFWFNGLVGLYGWLDTTFPNWVYNAALIPAALITALLARALLTHGTQLRNRLPEIITYTTISLGVLVAIGIDDYIHHVPSEYTEPRYLLPLLALWGAALALAARGAGKRWGPITGALIVTLILAHNIFSQLLVVSRYYG